jgi:hypothetical protein
MAAAASASWRSNAPRASACSVLRSLVLGLQIRELRRCLGELGTVPALRVCERRPGGREILLESFARRGLLRELFLEPCLASGCGGSLRCQLLRGGRRIRQLLLQRGARGGVVFQRRIVCFLKIGKTRGCFSQFDFAPPLRVRLHRRGSREVLLQRLPRRRFACELFLERGPMRGGRGRFRDQRLRRGCRVGQLLLQPGARGGVPFQRRIVGFLKIVDPRRGLSQFDVVPSRDVRPGRFGGREALLEPLARVCFLREPLLQRGPPRRCARGRGNECLFGGRGRGQLLIQRREGGGVLRHRGVVCSLQIEQVRRSLRDFDAVPSFRIRACHFGRGEVAFDRLPCRCFLRQPILERSLTGRRIAGFRHELLPGCVRVDSCCSSLTRAVAWIASTAS